MPTSTLTSKGQLTLPKPIRDRLGVHKGDRIEFVLGPDGAVQLRPLTRSVRELAGCLAQPGQRPVRVEDMNASIAELLAEEDERIRSER